MIVIRPYQDSDASTVRRILCQFQNRDISQEEYNAKYQQEMKYDFFYRLVLQAGGQVVAYSDLFRIGGDTRDGYLQYRLRVDRPFRRRGYGRILDAATWQVIHEQAPMALEVTIRDNDQESRRFAERRGFTESLHRLASVIDLHRWNEKDAQQVIDRVRSNAIELLSMDEILDTNKWRQLYSLYCVLDQDTPDRQGVTQGPSFEHLEEQYVHNPLIPSANIFVARSAGQWIGMTVLEIRNETEAYTEFTGVAAAYRGQGIALALKGVSLLRARAHGIRIARTNNLSSNVPMLAVNQRLGYQSTPGLWLMDLRLKD